MKKFKTFKAFSLVEMLVVIAVIGIIAAIAVPAYLDKEALRKDKEAAQMMTAMFESATAQGAEFFGTNLDDAVREINGKGLTANEGISGVRFYTEFNENTAERAKSYMAFRDGKLVYTGAGTSGGAER